jgi:hypothetical protein
LRRLGSQLIAAQDGRKQAGDQTRKTEQKKTPDEEGRRAFNVNSRRKLKTKKTEFQTGGSPGLSFRR